MESYSKFIIQFSTLIFVISSIASAPYTEFFIPIALLLIGACLIHFGLAEKKARFHLCIAMVVICLLVALATGWAEADALKTFNSQELRQRLSATIGLTATSDFFIAQAATSRSMGIHKSSALLNMFILAIYSAFLTKK